MTRVVLGGVAVLAGGLLLDQQAPQQPVFRAGVDVVLVDAYVVDRQGRPVTDLSLADFEVALDRRSRRVVSADLLRVGAEQPEPVPGSATIADASGAVTPAHRHGPRIGRTMLLAVDLRSLHPRHLNGFRQSLVRFALQLSPDDRLGLYASPPDRVVVEPTTDRNGVLDRLQRMDGLFTEPITVHFISPSEVVDIVAGDEDAFERVVHRECHDRTDRACRALIRKQAIDKADACERIVSEIVRGLRPLFDDVARLEGPGRPPNG